MEATTGKRNHFQVLATTTPKLVVGAGSRQCVVIYNNSSGNMYIGLSGSLLTLGMVLPSNTPYTDMFSSDEWWAVTSSGSGTVSGYTVI